MQYEDDEVPVKLDANGNPDVRYYISEAHRMRGEAIHALAAQAATGLRRQVQQLLHALHLDGRLPSLHH